MVFVNANDGILKLDYLLYVKLVNSLDENDNWKKVANYVFAPGLTILSTDQINEFARSESPAERLLQELDNRFCTVEILGKILLDLCLSNAAAAISENEPVEITFSPGKLVVGHVGETLRLECFATGFPLPKYEWQKDNTILPGNGNVLTIHDLKANDSGIYRCFVTNGISEIYTDGTSVFVENNRQSNQRLNTEDVEFNFETDSSLVLRPVLPRCRPSMKAAIVIGNYDYANLERLYTVLNDIETISDILRDKGFTTLTLKNLTLDETTTEMERFCQQLLPKAYVFMYYAGHGFQFGDNYILPTDASSIYKLADGISERKINRDVLRTKPTMFVILLDMCLNVPTELENPDIYKEKCEKYIYTSDRNLIAGCSTSHNLPSYERIDVNHSVYMKHLKKLLILNRPILKILQAVISEIAMESSDAVNFQMPTLSYNTHRDFYLNDTIQPNGD